MEYLILYVVSVVVTLPTFVYQHAWVRGYDIRFPEFTAMTLCSLIPVLNLIVMVWIIDWSWLDEKLSFVVIKGRRG